MTPAISAVSIQLREFAFFTPSAGILAQDHARSQAAEIAFNSNVEIRLMIRSIVPSVAALVIVGACATSVSAEVVALNLIQDLNADFGVAGPAAGVTGWTNQAAGGDSVATNGGTIELVAGPNGHSALRFTDGDRMAGASGTAFDGLLQGNGHTWFAIVKAGAQNNNDKNAIFGNLVSGSPFSGIIAHVANSGGGGATGNYILRPSTADNAARGATNINDGGFHIISGTLSAGVGTQRQELYIGGGAAEATNILNILNTTDSGPLTIGAERVGGGEHIDADIARILIYDRPLSIAEMNQTGNRLSALYGATWEKTLARVTLQTWDFEGGSLQGFSLVGPGAAWDRDEDGTPSAPVRYSNTDAQNPFGGGEWFLRSDYADEDGSATKPGDGPQGVLESASFLLHAGARIDFEAAGAGGNLQVVEDGTGTVLATLAPNRQSIELGGFGLDLGAHVGKNVFLRISDTSSGGWGHIALDNIRYSATIPEPSSWALVCCAAIAAAPVLRRRLRIRKDVER
jgi:hypothetical protein